MQNVTDAYVMAITQPVTVNTERGNIDFLFLSLQIK